MLKIYFTVVIQLGRQEIIASFSLRHLTRMSIAPKTPENSQSCVPTYKTDANYLFIPGQLFPCVPT